MINRARSRVRKIFNSDGILRSIIEQMAAIIELNAFYAASRWGCYIP
jgi:hypothetical protein